MYLKYYHINLERYLRNLSCLLWGLIKADISVPYYVSLLI